MRTIGIDLGTTNTVAAIEGTIVQHASGHESSAILPRWSHSPRAAPCSQA